MMPALAFAAVAAGLFFLISAIKDWDWIYFSMESLIVKQYLGESGVRWLTGLSGITLMALPFLAALGVFR